MYNFGGNELIAMAFTFIQHPLISLLENHFSIFTDVSKVVAVFSSQKNTVLQAILKSRDKQIKLSLPEDQTSLLRFRKEKTNFSWLDKASLPFKVQESGIFQKELFEEIEKTVLLVKIPTSYSNEKDLLFIYYNKDLNNFSPSLNNSEHLSTHLKSIIGKIMFNNILSIVEDINYNQKVLNNNFNKKTLALIASNQAYQRTIEDLKQDKNNPFVNIVKSLFYKYLNNTNCSITLSDRSLDLLTTLSNDYELLSKTIKNAVQFLETIYNYQIPSHIVIDDYLINTQDIKNEKIEENRYTKTKLLLEHLNDAVKKVIDKQLSPTGVNVGKAMEKPISAPAISDALKKHRSKILTLLDKYPQNWTYLRQYFKPLQNIALTKKEHYYKQA